MEQLKRLRKRKCGSHKDPNLKTQVLTWLWTSWPVNTRWSLESYMSFPPTTAQTQSRKSANNYDPWSHHWVLHRLSTWISKPRVSPSYCTNSPYLSLHSVLFSVEMPWSFTQQNSSRNNCVFLVDKDFLFSPWKLFFFHSPIIPKFTTRK